MNFDEIFNSIDQERQAQNINSKVLIIDGLNTWIRIFASVPTISENGEHIGGILGFLRSIASNIRDFNPTRCVLVFDGRGGSLRRKKIYPEYKNNRTHKHSLRRDLFSDPELEQQEMRRQLLRILNYLTNLPVQILGVDNIEADDVIAHLTKQYFEPKGSKVRIVSTDRDFLQLINGQIEVYSPVKKKLYQTEDILESFGLIPDNYLLYRMIDGDTSDNIPGINGIGLKTLLKEFPELGTEVVTKEQLFQKCESKLNEKKVKKIFQLIAENEHILDRNYRLMQLNDTDISLDSKLRIQSLIEQPINPINKVNLRQLISEDYLHKHLRNFDEWLQLSFSLLNVWANKYNDR